jgi:hypothetical protein
MKTLIDNNRILVILFMLAIFISSCKKDEKNELSRTELLTREWNVTSIDGQSVLDYAGLDTLLIKFESDGDIKMTWKYAGESMTFAYSWSWKDNENTLQIIDGSDTYDWVVEKLTLNEFWFNDSSDQTMFKCSSN